MEHQLTREEASRVFTLHFGCETLCVDTNSETLKMYSYAYVGSKFKLQLNRVFTVVIFRDFFKLLLTPLSKITDEHALAVAKMQIAGLHGEIKMKELKAELFSKNNFLLKIDYYANNQVISAAQLTFGSYQYLIQQGYAVPLFFGINHPCNGKDAIELGIAIDKSLHLQTNI